MPVEFRKRNESNGSPAGAALIDENGNRTALGQAVLGFLESVDWNHVLQTEGLDEVLGAEDIVVRRDEQGKIVPCEATDESAAAMRVLYTPGSVIEALTDRGDLAGMFDYYIDHCLGEGIEANIARSALADVSPRHFTEEAIDEAGKKKKKKKAESIGEGDPLDRLLTAGLRAGYVAAQEADSGVGNAMFLVDEMREPHREYLNQVNRKLLGSGAMVNQTTGQGFGHTSDSTNESLFRAVPREDVTNALETAKNEVLDEAGKPKIKQEKLKGGVKKPKSEDASERRDFSFHEGESVTAVGARMAKPTIAEMEKAGTAREVSEKKK